VNLQQQRCDNLKSRIFCIRSRGSVFDIVTGLRAGRSRVRISVGATHFFPPKTSRSCTSAPLRGLYGNDRKNLTFYLTTLHILRTKKGDNDDGCSHIKRGADKSLARPGRKQANVSVRMA